MLRRAPVPTTASIPIHRIGAERSQQQTTTHPTQPLQRDGGPHSIPILALAPKAINHCSVTAMSAANIRQRSAAKGGSSPVHIIREASSPRYGGKHHSKLHLGVCVRMLSIVGLFTTAVLLLSRIGNRSSVIGTSGGGLGGAATYSACCNQNFVSVVLPSVVKPEGRPLRLANIAKTWGSPSRAIYVVHDADEYPDGADVTEDKSSGSYPKNLVVPPRITAEAGVERLEFVIRAIHTEINPGFAFFVNDHTFVLPNHLCEFLKDYDGSSDDLYAGHALKGKGETAFNSGAAGYVLSRSTMERLIKEWDDPNSKCSPAAASKWIQGNPGLLTAQCFIDVLGIPVVDTRDKQDLSHKFHAYGIIRTVTGKVDEWYLNKHKELDNILGVDTQYHHQLQAGGKCCSAKTVSFHYVEAGESVAFWETMQKINQSRSMSDADIKELMNKVWPRDREGLGGYAHGLPSPRMAIWNDIAQVVRKISDGVAAPSC